MLALTETFSRGSPSLLTSFYMHISCRYSSHHQDDVAPWKADKKHGTHAALKCPHLRTGVYSWEYPQIASFPCC
jgi:hypothetical protein